MEQKDLFKSNRLILSKELQNLINKDDDIQEFVNTCLDKHYINESEVSYEQLEENTRCINLQQGEVFSKFKYKEIEILILTSNLEEDNDLFPSTMVFTTLDGNIVQ